MEGLPRTLARLGQGATDRRREQAGEHRPEPGCRPGEQVVEAGGGPSEPRVVRTPVSYPGIQGIRGPVADHSGRTDKGAPQQRPHHRVGGVFGDRLDSRPAQLLRIQPARVPAHQRRGQLPGSFELSAPHRVAQGPAGQRQRPPPQGALGHHGEQQQPGERTVTDSPVRPEGRGGRPAHQPCGVGDPGHPRRPPCQPFQSSGDRAETGDGMPAAGVAHCPVGHEPSDQAERPRPGWTAARGYCASPRRSHLTAHATGRARRCRLTCGCQIFGSCHATCAYSWISPPSRSRRATLPAGGTTGGWADPSGGACPRARCGRWPL
jgi:hypothetical protein